MKANSKGKIEVKYSFLKPLSQNFEVLTLCVDVINPKMYQKGPRLYFIYKWWYKDGNQKKKILWEESFIYETLLSKLWSFDSTWWRRQATLTCKRAQACISCTNGDTKMKIKSKRNFEMRYLFMKLFSQNPKILVTCCDVIIPKFGQKDPNLYNM